MAIVASGGEAACCSAKKPQVPPLRYAPPDFLLRLAALANFMLLSVAKAANAAVSGDAWQEIRVRSG